MNVIADAGLLVLGYMTAWFIVALLARRNDVADVAWGLGFVVLAWWGTAAGASASGPAPRAVLVALLVTVWGVRLATHVGRRNFSSGSTEDPRYAAWRAEWGRLFVVRSYLQVFLLQGAFMLLVAAPLLVLAADPGPATIAMTDGLGVLLWALGLGLEATADRQLARHLAEPANRGRPLTTGAWGWSRHPNYLGDALAWWGIGVIALAAPNGWLGLIGPAAMTLLLRFVSGVPMLERRHTGEPEWDRYREQVGIFLPRPPGATRRS